MTERTITVSGGEVDITEHGEGPPVVLLHGLLLDASFWDDVAERLVRAGWRVIVPTLPLGTHRTSWAGADLTPPGLAAAIAEVLDEVAHREGVTAVPVVSNDTATALTQIVLTTHPERVSAAVLTTGDAYDVFLPPQFDLLLGIARRLPAALALAPFLARFGWVRRLRFVHGWLTLGGSTREQAVRWLGRLGDRAIRADATALARGISSDWTEQNAVRLPQVDVPVAVVWGNADRLFPLRLGQRLADDIPDAELHVVPARTTYLPLDHPDELSELVDTFLRTVSPSRPAG